MRRETAQDRRVSNIRDQKPPRSNPPAAANALGGRVTPRRDEIGGDCGENQSCEKPFAFGGRPAIMPVLPRNSAPATQDAQSPHVPPRFEPEACPSRCVL